jgi:ATP-dependent DNA helicase RecG
MIDTIGGGIKRMFITQRNRFFPLPDYVLSEEKRVKVRITGRVIDENYTRILRKIPDLDLLDVIALDKVQKGKLISKEEQRRLKNKNLITGKRPNFYVSAKIADVTETRAEYIRKRAFDKEHYKKLVISYLKKFGRASRKEIDKLLLDKLSDALNEQQKKNQIMNLLQEMRKENIIKTVGGKRGLGSSWELHKPV